MTVAWAIEALASMEGDQALDELELGVSYGLSGNISAYSAVEKKKMWEILKDDPMFPIRYYSVVGLKYCQSYRAKSLLRKAMNDPQAEIASLAREVLGETSN